MMFHQVSPQIVQNYVKWRDCRELEVVEKESLEYQLAMMKHGNMEMPPHENNFVTF